LVTAALALPVLLGVTGFAVDMGRLYAAQARLQTAVDAAALAGSLQLVTDPNVSNGGVANAVSDYLFRNYSQAYLTNLKPGTSIRSVCLTAQVDVPMTFMALMAVNSRPVTASSCAGFNDLEIVLVIDNTGSMSGSPITAVKSAANKLVDLMIPTSGSPAIKVGLVPFRGKVRIPAGYDGLAAGCRNANGGLANKAIGSPDYSCTDTAMPYTLPLYTGKTAIKTAINSMQAGNGEDYTSGTVIAEGIKWGRHVLTPDAPFTEGGAKGKFRKVMILLTDGDNEDGTCGGAYGSCDPRSSSSCTYRRNAYFQITPTPVTNCNCNSWGCMDQAMLTQAQNAKDIDGIEIFSIRYGSSDSVDIQLMKTVASSNPGTEDHYFDAPSTADIQKVFDKIGRQLGFRLL
jgi:Flp pilus assembly protein TadG